jgi:hypothetical protein
MQNLWTCKRHGMKLRLCTRLEKVITGKLTVDWEYQLFYINLASLGGFDLIFESQQCSF